jgi:hypothetical protein
MSDLPTLTVLHRAEFPGEKYATVMVLIENASGAPRHTHPGLEMTYILEGEITLMVDGRPDQVLKAGDWFEVPAEVPHNVVRFRFDDRPIKNNGAYQRIGHRYTPVVRQSICSPLSASLPQKSHSSFFFLTAEFPGSPEPARSLQTLRRPSEKNHADSLIAVATSNISSTIRADP